jgi:hypothetical protein
VGGVNDRMPTGKATEAPRQSSEFPTDHKSVETAVGSILMLPGLGTKGQDD